MSDDDRQRWNQRYANTAPSATQQPPAAAAVLHDNQHLLPVQGRALDLACGRGGNALLLARQGLKTEAWDIADKALQPLQQYADQRGLPLTTHCVDLDLTPLPTAHYDVICVSGFLQRALCPTISAALKPGGVLFYQTFTRLKATADSGPSNPAFVLAPAELLRLFHDLEIRVYREEAALGDLQHGLRNQAYLVAQRPQPSVSP